MALKPPSQAAVLGVDAYAALSHVKPGEGKVQSYAHSLGMRLGSRGQRQGLDENLSQHQN